MLETYQPTIDRGFVPSEKEPGARYAALLEWCPRTGVLSEGEVDGGYHTCGHKHRSVRTALKCGQHIRILDRDPDVEAGTYFLAPEDEV